MPGRRSVGSRARQCPRARCSRSQTPNYCLQVQRCQARPGHATGFSAPTGVRSFGELEAAIMARVWLAGRPVLVREIWAGLRPEREPAFNTVQTVMETLYRKGWLAREKHGRAYRYWARVSREDYT